MAQDIDIEKYNPIAKLLLEAFDEAEISEREGSGGKSFSYVPPERYRYRLLKVFTNGYTFHLTNTTEGKLGVKGTAHFIGDVPEEGVRYDIMIDVFEPWTFKRDSKDILNPEQSFMKLASAGIKACAREIGLGLHLYDKAQNKTSGGSKPASKSSGSKPAASKSKPKSDDDGDHGDYSKYYDEEWDGSEKLKFTKQKGTPYNELEDGMISWLINKEDQDGNPNPDKGALKEMARRMHEGGGEAEERASASNNAKDDDEEFPF